MDTKFIAISSKTPKYISSKRRGFQDDLLLQTESDTSRNKGGLDFEDQINK